MHSIQPQFGAVHVVTGEKVAKYRRFEQAVEQSEDVDDISEGNADTEKTRYWTDLIGKDEFGKGTKVLFLSFENHPTLGDILLFISDKTTPDCTTSFHQPERLQYFLQRLFRGEHPEDGIAVGSSVNYIS